VRRLPESMEPFTPTAVHGDTLHGAANAAIQYDSDAQTLGGTPLAPTEEDQTLKNLMHGVKNVRDRLGPQYVKRCGDAWVFGQGAISQHFMSAVRAATAGGDLTEIPEKSSVVAQNAWIEPEVPDGAYVLEVGDRDRLVVHVLTAADGTRTADRGQVDKNSDLQCHAVQVTEEMWTAFTHPQHPEDQGCIHAVTNGRHPFKSCVCDIKDCEQCPGSTATRGGAIPRVVADMVVPLASAAWDLKALPALQEVVYGCAEYQHRELFCEKQEAVTKQTMRECLEQHCGEAWTSRHLGSQIEREPRLEKAVLEWLRSTVGGGCKKMVKNATAEVMKIWKRSPPPPRFFRGQRIFAKWTDEHGRLDDAVNREKDAPGWTADGFPAAVIGPGETPSYWRVGFDDGHDHPSIPSSAITVDPAPNVA